MGTNTFPRWIRGFVGVALIAVFLASWAGAAQADDAFIYAPQRRDMVHDPARNILYITNGPQILRYHIGSGTLLAPFQCDANSSLYGIDISPDNNTLVACDTTVSTEYLWFWVFDLRTGVGSKRLFARGMYDAGTFAVAFGADGRALITAQFPGSGWVPLRSYDPSTDTTTTLPIPNTHPYGEVRQDTMVSASADRGFIGIAEANQTAQKPSRYRVSDGGVLFGPDLTGFLSEIAVSPNGAQYAVVTQMGTYIFDSAMQQVTKLGAYLQETPIGGVYSPTKNVLYLAWSKTGSIRAHSTTDFSVVGGYDAGSTFSQPGISAFNQGRLRISGDGRFLFATVKDGVRVYTLLPPNRLAFGVQPTSTGAGANIDPAVRVVAQDAEGHTATEFSGPVTLALGTNPSEGSLLGTKTVNAVDGVATFPDLRINQPGSGYTLTASTAGLASIQSDGFTISPGAPARLAFLTQPANAVAGQAVSPAVRVAVQDAAGNVVTTATASVTLALDANPGGGALSGTLTADAVNGIATFSNLSIEKTGTGCTLAAAAAGLASATSSPFNIDPGPAAQIVFFTQPTDTTAGATFAPAVQVLLRDAFGNTATTATTAVTMSLAGSPAGATLGGTLTRTPVEGIATFADLSVNRPGSGCTLTAAATGLPGATSTAFNISIGAPARLSFLVQPSSTGAGQAMAVRVAIVDAAGNTVTGADREIALSLGANPAGGALAGALARTSANGIAAFEDLRIEKMGAGYTLSAAADGLAGATSSPFDIGPGPAAKLAFLAQMRYQRAGAAIAPPVQVGVQDAFGNAVTAGTYHVSVSLGTGPGGTLTGTLAADTVAGIATFSDLSIDKAGTGYVLAAAAEGLSGSSSNAFDIVVGAPVRLMFLIQPTAASGGLDTVKVGIVDAGGNPVPGASTSIKLALGANPSGGTLTGTLTRNLAAGVAVFDDLRLDRPGDGYTLIASATGLDPVTSAPFALAPTDHPDLLIKQSAEPDTAFAAAGLYQATPQGDQVEALSVPLNTAASYSILLRNEGNAPRQFILRSRESGAEGWTISYTSGGAEIGRQLAAPEGYTTETLAPGASTLVALQMVPTAAAAVGTTRTALLSVLLPGGETVGDAVQATSTCQNRAPGVPESLAPAADALLSPTPTFRLKAGDPDGDPCKLTVELTQGDTRRVLQTEPAGSGEETSIGVAPEQALSSGRWSWRARAEDSRGAVGEWSAPATFLVNRAPGLPELITPGDGDLSTAIPCVVVRASDPDGDPLKLVVEFRQGDTVKTLQVVGSASGADAVLRGGAGDALGTGDWSWRAKAVDPYGVESEWSAVRALQVPASASDLARGPGLGLFSLSLQAPPVSPAEIGLADAHLAAWDPLQGRYLFDAEIGKLQSGAGYWLFSGTPLLPVFTGRAPSAPVAIPLRRGWNLIGQPFPSPVVWDSQALKVRGAAGEELSLSDASARGWLHDFAWSWQQDPSHPETGAYRLVYDTSIVPNVVGVLQPWQAFWINADQECSLVLPLPSDRAAAPARRRQAGGGWSVRVRAAGAGGSGEVTLGGGGGRALRVSGPPEPPTGQTLGLWLEREAARLAVDVRGEASVRQEWALVVAPHRPANTAAGSSEEITLAWPDLRALPRGASLLLVDEATGTRRSMRATGGYTFRSQGETRRFRILAEPQAGPALALTGLEMTSGRGASHSVAFNLSAMAVVDLELTSPSGATVAVVAQGRAAQAGANRVSWSGTLRPGIYLLRARATSEEGASCQTVRPVLATR